MKKNVIIPGVLILLGIICLSIVVTTLIKPTSILDYFKTLFEICLIVLCPLMIFTVFIVIKSK
ncbi:hypothetical protein [Cytobacillus sp. IB215316]|uniref:hypothetical protein n=1 Tax=Cytobacillus sp. IB215316 TaxID=3097354 RepID=UPI002A0C12F8|nr:hypothetical protein [Cytobacillus sp. IB215316]MDX8362472.1 hypothetical protein [Cytobacillus sp. IB215316]